MPTNSTTPETAKLFQTAWQAAHAAGDLIRENWHRPKEIAYKGAIDLVTSVDRDAERCKAIRVGDDVRTSAVAAHPNGDDRWVLEEDKQIRHTIGSAFLDQRTLQCERVSVWDDT